MSAGIASPPACHVPRSDFLYLTGRAQEPGVQQRPAAEQQTGAGGTHPRTGVPMPVLTTRFCSWKYGWNGRAGARGFGIPGITRTQVLCATCSPPTPGPTHRSFVSTSQTPVPVPTRGRCRPYVCIRAGTNGYGRERATGAIIVFELLPPRHTRRDPFAPLAGRGPIQFQLISLCGASQKARSAPNKGEVATTPRPGCPIEVP